MSDPGNLGSWLIIVACVQVSRISVFLRKYLSEHQPPSAFSARQSDKMGFLSTSHMPKEPPLSPNSTTRFDICEGCGLVHRVGLPVWFHQLGLVTFCTNLWPSPSLFCDWRCVHLRQFISGELPISFSVVFSLQLWISGFLLLFSYGLESIFIIPTFLESSF